MTDALKCLSKEAYALLEKASLPDSVEPMKAILVDEPFSSPDWIFERKLDGERCLLQRRGKQVSLLSRNSTCKNTVYPEIASHIEALPGDYILDCEIVTFSHQQTSFKKLQKRIHRRHPDADLRRRIPVYGYVFDILHLDGFRLTGLPLRERKKALKSFVGKSSLRYLRHRNERGRVFFRDACERGWEGLIAKKADSVYEQKRSRQWLKIKCSRQQEFVVAGFTDPTGKREGFGALLIGYYEQDKLLYAGRVGTGFDDEFLAAFREDLDFAKRDTCPFEGYDGTRQGVHWVRPSFVAEIGFTEWTSSGRLRHPRFLGLRKDKEPASVRRERAS